MKNLYYILSLALILSLNNLSAQIIEFKDPVFKEKLLSATADPDYIAWGFYTKNLEGEFFNLDTNKDGEISQEEALEVSDIEFAINAFSTVIITDVSELRHFKNLKRLRLEGFDITSVDTSKLIKLENLSIENNKISEIDLSQNVNLEYLKCMYSNLTTLEVSNNNKLVSIWCGHNPITKLDISNLENLHTLYVDNTNLNSINFGNKPELSKLKIHDNPELSELDLSTAPKLERLECQSINVKELDLTNNPQLTYLLYPSNVLEKILLKSETRTTTLTGFAVGGNVPSLKYICANEHEIDYLKSRVYTEQPLTIDSLCDQDLSTPNLEFNTAFKLTPNPVQDQINITSHSSATVQFIQVITPTGEVVASGNKSILDVSNLNKGLYFVIVQTNYGNTSTKFMKL